MGTAVDVSGLLQRQRDTSADESVEHEHGHRHGKSGVHEDQVSLWFRMFKVPPYTLTSGIMIAWNGMIMDAAISAKNTLENVFFARVK